MFPLESCVDLDFSIQLLRQRIGIATAQFGDQRESSKDRGNWRQSQSHEVGRIEFVEKVLFVHVFCRTRYRNLCKRLTGFASEYPHWRVTLRVTECYSYNY